MGKLLTVSEAAARIGISPRTLEAYCRKGKIGFIAIDDRGTRRFTEAQLDEYIERRTTPARVPEKIDAGRRTLLPSCKPNPRETENESRLESVADLRKEMRRW